MIQQHDRDTCTDGLDCALCWPKGLTLPRRLGPAREDPPKSDSVEPVHAGPVDP
jgi:hypothetical protein